MRLSKAAPGTVHGCDIYKVNVGAETSRLLTNGLHYVKMSSQFLKGEISILSGIFTSAQVRGRSGKISFGCLAADYTKCAVLFQFARGGNFP